MAAILAAAAGAGASILAFEQRIVPLAKGKIARDTTYSKGWVPVEAGLDSPRLGPGESMDAWLESDPVPAGLAWRPPRSLRLALFVEGSWAPDPKGGATVPWASAYVRHGCDRVTWTTWQVIGRAGEGAAPAPAPPLDAAGKPIKPVYVWVAEVGVPDSYWAPFEARRSEWWKTDPDWKSDDDEYARWLVAKDPTFFARNPPPFLGWLQFRIEWSSLGRGLRLAALHAQLTWAVGGMHVPAKPGAAKGKDSRNWFLDLRGAAK